MKPVVFVTANASKHAEVQRLLAGLDVRWDRLDLARPDTGDLEAIATARVLEAYRRLETPCFLENTGLWLWEHEGAPGASFKRTWRELGEEGFAARFGGARGVARVVVALAESSAPADVRLFTGSITGSLLRAPRGTGSYGWDRLWVPDGYDRTLGWTHSCGSGESIARIVSGPQPEVNFASVGLTTRTRIPALSAEGMASGQSLDMTSHHNNRSIE